MGIASSGVVIDAMRGGGGKEAFVEGVFFERAEHGVILHASASVKAAMIVSGDSSPTEMRNRFAGTPQSSVQSSSS